VYLSTWLGYRYTPAVVKARRLIEEGLLGNLLGAHLAFFNNKPASYFAGNGSGSGSNWRSRWDTCGGGILLMTGIHYLDWLLYLTSMKVEDVSARYATLHSPAEVEDSIVMWLTFANGALASTNMSSCVQGGNTTNVELRIWGADGHLSLTPPFQFYPTRLIDGRLPERWSSLEPLPPMRFGDERMHISVEYLEHFARAILNGQAPDVPVDAGLELQAIIEAAYQSSREGRPITVQYPEWQNG
jgi:predicted dehydrogenase